MQNHLQARNLRARTTSMIPKFTTMTILKRTPLTGKVLDGPNLGHLSTMLRTGMTIMGSMGDMERSTMHMAEVLTSTVVTVTTTTTRCGNEDVTK